MTYCPKSLSIKNTVDTISTTVIDTIHDVTLTNRTYDLPKQRFKQSTRFSHDYKLLKISRIITPLESPHTLPLIIVINLFEVIAKENIVSLFDTKAERIVISYYYHIAIHSPPKYEWSGISGTIPIIRHIF